MSSDQILPAEKPKARRQKRGFLNSAGKGGPARLVAICLIAGAIVATIVGLSLQHEKNQQDSQVAKMHPMNLLPGGLNATPAQEALRIKHANAEAEKAQNGAKSYTPAMPGSELLQAHEVGVEDPLPAAPPSPPPIKVILPDPPKYTPPERPAVLAAQAAVFNQLPKVDDDRPKIIKAAASTEDAAPPLTPAQVQVYQKMMGQWDIAAPRTTLVLPEKPAAEPIDAGATNNARVEQAGTPASGNGVAKAKVLVPAGRGIYAHTVLSVNSDSGGPIVLEADTGPLMGDRMIGTFAKVGNDRLVVRVSKLIHRGEELDVNGLAVAPDSMETTVASNIDQHYLERFALPAAAAFVQGLGQAAAMSNTISTVSPYGTVTSQISPMKVSQEAWIGAGAAAQAIGHELTQTTPKGPTIYLDANVALGVMFLDNVAQKQSQ